MAPPFRCRETQKPNRPNRFELFNIRHHSCFNTGKVFIFALKEQLYEKDHQVPMLYAGLNFRKAPETKPEPGSEGGLTG